MFPSSAPPPQNQALLYKGWGRPRANTSGWFMTFLKLCFFPELYFFPEQGCFPDVQEHTTILVSCYWRISTWIRTAINMSRWASEIAICD